MKRVSAVLAERFRGAGRQQAVDGHAAEGAR
jgi:hypothetical protein